VNGFLLLNPPILRRSNREAPPLRSQISLEFALVLKPAPRQEAKVPE